MDVIAAFQAVNRVDDFAFTPEQSISHGITTFTAQNLGSRQDEERKRERVGAGLRTGLLLEFLYWIFIFLLVYLGRVPVMEGLCDRRGQYRRCGGGEPVSGDHGFLYLLPAFTNGLQGFSGEGENGNYSGRHLHPDKPSCGGYLSDRPVLGILRRDNRPCRRLDGNAAFEVPCLFFFRDRTVKQKK